MITSRQRKQPFCSMTIPALLLTSILLVSCMSAKQLPQDHYYRLPYPAPQAFAVPIFSDTVGVKKIRTDGILNDRSLLYVNIRHPLEVKRSSYNYWQEAPAVLLQKHLAAFLSTSGAAKQIICYEPGMAVDTLISGHLLQFEREIGKKEAAVYVVLELSAKSSSKNMPTRTYSQRIICRDYSVEAAADGFGTALENIYRKFLEEQ